MKKHFVGKIFVTLLLILSLSTNAAMTTYAGEYVPAAVNLFPEAADAKAMQGPTTSITISAAGDCTLGIDSRYSHNFNKYYKKKGDSYFLRKARSVFSRDDITIVNFEGTLTGSTKRARKTFAFKGPKKYASILKKGSVEVVNLANNHSKDYGKTSLTDTQETLKKNKQQISELEEKLKKSRLENADERLEQIGSKASQTALKVLLIVGSAAALIGGIYEPVLVKALLFGLDTFLFSYLRKKKVSRVIRLIGIVWLGLFPTVVMFTLCSAKDALFTLALLLLLVCLLEMGTEEPFFDKKGWQLLFVLAGTGMMLLRNNGFYAFLVMIPLLLLLQKKRRGRLLLLTVCAVAGCLLINGGLKLTLHADDSEYQELLTVPIQQLARTCKYAPEAFSERKKSSR